MNRLLDVVRKALDPFRRSPGTSIWLDRPRYLPKAIDADIAFVRYHCTRNCNVSMNDGSGIGKLLGDCREALPLLGVAAHGVWLNSTDFGTG